MAAFGSVASAKASSATSVVVTKPTGLAAGDLMVAFVTEGNSGGTPSTPSGWTLIANINDIGFSGMDTYCFAKIADAGDAAASNFTFSYGGTNTNIEAILYRITGTFAAVNNIYAYAADATGTESTNVFQFSPGLTPYVASSLIIFHSHGLHATTNTGDNITSFEIETSNPTWTEDVSDMSSGTTRSYGSGHATRTETTDTGYYQITYNSDFTKAGAILIAIADTQNGTATPAVISLTSSVPTPTSTGAANVTIGGPISLASSMPSVTAVGGDNDALWKNTNKPSTASFTNTDKL